MGLVFAAHQLSLNRMVALKFLRDAAVADDHLLCRFRAEAESIARLDHPNIVKIHEMGDFQGLPYLCMELLEGESLRDRLVHGAYRLNGPGTSRSGALEKQREIARLVGSLARALEHAHQRHVLHRDIKPENIVIDPGGKPRLTDFGLAKFLEPRSALLVTTTFSQPGAPVGTPSYMSPEQADGSEATAATDVYGLGAVLYELLTGEPPFRGTSVAETLQWVKELPPRRPRSVHPFVDRDLETICLRCLEKDPFRRFASMAALAEDLEAWLDGRPIRSRRLGPLERSVRWMRRNRTGTALIGSLLVMLGLTLTFLVKIARHEETARIAAATLVEERHLRLMSAWETPGVTSLRISWSDLVLIGDGRIILEPEDAIRVSMGAEVTGNLMRGAKIRYPMLLRVGSDLGKRLGRPVIFDFVALKPGAGRLPSPAVEPVDVQVLEPLACLDLLERDPQVTVLGQRQQRRKGVLVVGVGSGIEQVGDLVGRTIAFGRQDDILTVRAKARLADASLAAARLRAVHLRDDTEAGDVGVRTAHSMRSHSRELAQRVARREADAAPTLSVRFELYRSLGLASIAEFECEGPILVARSGLDPRMVKALREAFCDGKNGAGTVETPISFDWEETLDVLVPMDNAALDNLRQAARQAARFDGQPNPFPSGSTASLKGN